MPRSRTQKNKKPNGTRYQKAYFREEAFDGLEGIDNEIAPEEYNKDDNQQNLDQAVYKALLQAEKAQTTEEQIKIIYRAYNGVLLFGPSNYEHFAMIDNMNGTIVKAVQVAIDQYTQDHINEALQVVKSIPNQGDEHIAELLGKQISKLELVIKFYSIIEMSMDLGNKTSAFDMQRAKQLINKCRDIINEIQKTYNVVIEHMPPPPRGDNQNDPRAWQDTNQEPHAFPQHNNWHDSNGGWPDKTHDQPESNDNQALVPWSTHNQPESNDHQALVPWSQNTTPHITWNPNMSEEEYTQLHQ